MQDIHALRLRSANLFARFVLIMVFMLFLLNGPNDIGCGRHSKGLAVQVIPLFL